MSTRKEIEQRLRDDFEQRLPTLIAIARQKADERARNTKEHLRAKFDGALKRLKGTELALKELRECYNQLESGQHLPESAEVLEQRERDRFEKSLPQEIRKAEQAEQDMTDNEN